MCVSAFCTNFIVSMFGFVKYLMSYARDASRKAYLGVKCPLFLARFKQNWNISINFSKPYRRGISWHSVQRFSICCMRVGREKTSRGHVETCFFINSLGTLAERHIAILWN